MSEPDVITIERRQRGVLTRGQATERFGRAAVRRQLGAGRWAAVSRRVLVLHNGPLTTEQLLWSAVLSAPHGSVLGSWSALTFDGLVTAEATPAHVVVPHKARSPAFTGVLGGCVVTRSAVLGDDSVHPHRLPPRTRPARSVVDAALRCTSLDAARLALVRGVQAGVTRPAELRAALGTRGRCRRSAELHRIVDELEGGVRSLPEQRFSALIRRAGLPEPARQVVVQGLDGRYYLDADWPGFGVSAEVHGAHHGQVQQLEHDWRRHNDVTALGNRRVLHFSAHQVRSRPEQVAAVLHRALLAVPARPPSDRAAR